MDKTDVGAKKIRLLGVGASNLEEFEEKEEDDFSLQQVFFLRLIVRKPNTVNPTIDTLSDIKALSPILFKNSLDRLIEVIY